MNNNQCLLAIAVILATGAIVLGEENPSPSPIMTQIRELQFEGTFDTADFDEVVLVAKDGTRWGVKDGVLLGRSWPVEYVWINS